MLPDHAEEEIVFLAARITFHCCSLTAEVRSHKILFYNSARAPEAAGLTLKRFDSRTRTNWH